MASTAIQTVLDELLEKEGFGDTLTSVKTGAKGLTDSTKKRLKDKHGDELSDDELIEKYLEEIETNVKDQWGGEGEMDDAVLSGLIDLGYNLGENIFSQYKGLKGALNEGDQGEAMRQTLDTVKVTDKDGNRGTSRGLARRRAENYNAAAASLGLNPITEVVQEEGRVSYRKGEEDFAQHSGAPVPSSKVGSLSVKDKGAVFGGKDDDAIEAFAESAPTDRGFDPTGDTFGVREPEAPSLQEEAEFGLEQEANKVLGFEEASPGIPLGVEEPISASEEDADALEFALSGIRDEESTYDPLANQRSVLETDDPDLLAADEAFYRMMEEAGQF